MTILWRTSDNHNSIESITNLIANGDLRKIIIHALTIGFALRNCMYTILNFNSYNLIKLQ